jgi:hypothetical protein
MSNLDTAAELNKLLKEQNKILEAQAKIMKSQATIMKSVVESMQKISGMDTTESLNEMNKALKEADKALEDLSGTQQKTWSGINKSAKQANKHMGTMADKIANIGKKAAKFAVFATTMEGLAAGARLGAGAIGSLLSVTWDLSKSFLNLGASIIAVPFKILNGLMSEAASYSGGELRQAIEDLRKEMGDLSTNEGKAVMDTFRHMRKEGTMTGLGLYRVFGNMAEQLRELTRIAMAMGRNFGNMTKEFMSHGRQIGEYVKGLGLSEDGIKAVTKKAEASGKEFIEITREITTMAFGMGDAFGINGKLISKDIAEMVGDFENFGSIGIKQMSQIAVYTRKLGVEVKDLLGVIGKFDDFETAAQSAAQLSQAFGIQVDTLEMLKEQDPAARFESLRKAFLATGKSVESLSRQELNLLSTQTGISQEALKLGFSQSKAGMSYEEVQKQSEKTEKKQLSQAQAMEKLSMSIELLVKQGQQMEGGFFNIFLQGFKQGMRHTSQFWGLMRQLHVAMRSTFQAGRQVGHMFMEYFPGINDIFSNMSELLSKIGGFRRTKKGFVAFGFLGDIIEDFKKFFKALSTDPKVALKNLFKDMSKHFFDNFSNSKAAGMKILGGIRSFFKTMAGLFATGVEMAMKGLTGALHMITEIIRDPSGFMKGAKSGKSGFASVVAEMLSPMWEAIKESWPELQKAFIELWHVASEKFGPAVEKFKNKAIAFIEKAAIGAAVSRLVLSSVMFGLAKAGEMIVAKGSPLIGKSLSKLFESTSNIPDIKKGAEKMQSALSGTSSMAQSMKKADASVGKVNWKAMGKNMLIGLGAMAGVAGVMAGTYYLIKNSMSSLKVEDISLMTKAIGAMGVLFAISAGVVLASVGTGALLAIPGVAPVALLGLAAFASVATAMVFYAKEIISQIDQMSISSGIERKVAIFTTVAKTMTEFAGVFLEIIKASTPSFSGLIGLFRGTNPMLEGIKATGELIKTMSVELKSVVAQIVELTKSVTPEQIKAGEMIGSIITSMAELMKAFVPPPELMPGYLGKLMGKPSLEKISEFMTTTMTAMKDTLIPSIREMVLSISMMPDIDQTKIGIFNSFMSGVTSLLQAMKPTEGMTNLLKETENNSFWSKLVPWGKKQGDEANKASPMSSIIGDMISSLTGPNGILPQIQKFMSTIIETVSKLGDSEKIKNSTELFTSVMSALTSVSQMFSDDNMKDFQSAVAAGKTKTMFQDFNKNILVPMNEDLPAMFVGFSQLNANIGIAKKMFVGKVAGGMKDLVSEINSISTTLNGLEPIRIKAQMKDLSDKLGLKGKEELKIALNDINITINVEVALDADKFEESLRTRPGGSKFFVKGS